MPSNKDEVFKELKTKGMNVVDTYEKSKKEDLTLEKDLILVTCLINKKETQLVIVSEII